MDLPPLEDVAADEFRALVEQLREGTLSEATAPPADAVQPLQPGDVQPLPKAGSPLYQECLQRGEEAFRRGEVASVASAAA
jgi:UTP--glucose-1-phosphate uridylyltransferase